MDGSNRVDNFPDEGGVVMTWRSAVSLLADWLICCWELPSTVR